MSDKNDWGLYQIDGVKDAEKSLDAKYDEVISNANVAIHNGSQPELVAKQARDVMYDFMSNIEGYGASDTYVEEYLVSKISEDIDLVSSEFSLDR